MRVYLDCCCLQRPLDDQSQPRIRVETEAVLAILEAVMAGDVSLVGCDALELEINRIPDDIRREKVWDLLALASERIEIDEESSRMVDFLEASGIKGMDAVHLAIASTAQVDFFVTCDDRLLKYGRSARLDCQVVSAVELLAEVMK